MGSPSALQEIPLLDLDRPEAELVKSLRMACVEHGFFCIANHGVEIGLQDDLDQISREFFALPLAEKKKIAMTKGGIAWRGFFALGEELTSGAPDQKEGIYFGENLDAKDRRVSAGWPLHGANLYPSNPRAQKVVDLYIHEQTNLAHRLMRLVSLSLGLDADFIFNHFTKEPTLLFRVFHYPPITESEKTWGVGEHTDYGLLTILKQDDCGGLEVKTKQGWLAVEPQPNVFVCNIGDMLELLTRGLYRSTPHRVRNTSGRQRLSFPFFFDPGFEAMVRPLPLTLPLALPLSLPLPALDSIERWDRQNLHRFTGTYREYLLAKVSKVFPQLNEFYQLV